MWQLVIPTPFRDSWLEAAVVVVTSQGFFLCVLTTKSYPPQVDREEQPRSPLRMLGSPGNCLPQYGAKGTSSQPTCNRPHSHLPTIGSLPPPGFSASCVHAHTFWTVFN